MSEHHDHAPSAPPRADADHRSSDRAEPAGGAPPRAAAAAPAWRAAVVWLLVGIAGVALLAYVGAHLPRKPIGLAALAFGVLVAWGLLFLAAELRLARTRTLLAAVLLLVAIGQVGLGLASHRAFANERRKFWSGDPAAWIVEGARRQHDLSPDEIAALAEGSRERRQRLAEITSFRAWLQHRLTRLVTFPIDSPWPPLVWAVEVLAGTLLGVWLACRIALATGSAPAKLGEGGSERLQEASSGEDRAGERVSG